MTTAPPPVQKGIEDKLNLSFWNPPLPSQETPHSTNHVTQSFTKDDDSYILPEEMRRASIDDQTITRKELSKYFNNQEPDKKPYQSGHNLAYDLIEVLYFKLPADNLEQLGGYINELIADNPEKKQTTNELIGEQIIDKEHKDYEGIGFLINRNSDSAPLCYLAQVEMQISEDETADVYIALVERDRHKHPNKPSYFDVAILSQNGRIEGYMGKYGCEERFSYQTATCQIQKKIEGEFMGKMKISHNLPTRDIREIFESCFQGTLTKYDGTKNPFVIQNYKSS